MCYYNGVKVTHSEFIRLKAIEKAIAQYDFLSKPLLIGFDYQPIPVLKRVEGKQDFDVVEMEWGFLPPYIKTREQAARFRQGYKKENGQWQEPILTLNATSEEMLFERKMFREAALYRRCLVLSTGFYEWRHVFPIGKKTGKPLKTAVKYPYRILVKDREYFFLAGIYTPWKDEATGEYVETCAIVTTAANNLMEQIHNTRKRMPTILTEDLAWDWLFGELDETRISEIGRFQFPAQEMAAYTIVKDFREAFDPTAAFGYQDIEMQILGY
ncbi:MAG: SOS response-associated peptidase [Ferruginibacter sp.]